MRHPDTVPGAEPDHDIDEPSPAAVRAQLARILDDPRFTRSMRSSGILRHVVDETLAGRSYRINEQTIAVETFDETGGARAQASTAVRVAVGRLRRSLGEYYAEHESNPDDTVVIELPTGSYVPRFRWRRGAVPSVPRVVVFAFTDLGSDERLGYVPAALAESIALRLAAVTEFEVIGALDRVADDSSRRMGDTKGGRYAVTGSVRSHDGVIRVTATLVSPTGEVLWGESSDRTATSATVLEIEDQVVARVVGAIGDYLGVIYRHALRAGRLSSDAEVHAAMCEYLAYLHDLDARRVPDVLEALERAIARTSDSRLAAMCSGMHSAAAVIDPERAEEHLERAAVLARSAMAGAPNDPHVRFAQSTVDLARGRLDVAHAGFRELARLDTSNPSLLFGAGIGLVGTGDWDGGLAVIRSAMALNPGHPSSWGLYPALDEYARRNHAAAYRRAAGVDLQPTAIGAIVRAVTLRGLGDDVGARRALTSSQITTETELIAQCRVLAERTMIPAELAERISTDALLVLGV